MTHRRSLLLTLLALLASACDAPPTPEDAGPPDAGPLPTDYVGQAAPASSVIGGVRVETVVVETPLPPPNPETGVGTPDAAAGVELQRYRRDEEPRAEPRAILVAMPGIFAGAGSLDGYARGVVATASEPIEVWVIDRRGNQLEDRRGMDTAEVAGEPEIAFEYYEGRATIDGEAFDGFIPPTELSFMSEWGLAAHVADVHAVIGLVEASERRARVFLVGHSLGASFAEAYAAWRFEDGTRGSEELAGIVFIDGSLGDASVTEDEYRDGIERGGFPSPGLEGIRGATPNLAIPLLGIDIYAQAEVMALRASVDPTGVVSDRARDSTLSILLGYPAATIPDFTNAAAFALPFDEASGALAFARLGVGAPVGETEMFSSVLGDELVRPVATAAPIGWTDGPDVGESSSLEEFTRSFTAGPTNYAQWYFPARLPLDLAAVGGASVPDDEWQASVGLRAFDGALIDAPILAVACALVGSVERFETVRERVAPTVGEGRPLAGADRAAEGAFTVIDALTIQHLDPGVSASPDRNPAIGATLTFVERNAAPL